MKLVKRFFKSSASLLLAFMLCASPCAAAQPSDSIAEVTQKFVKQSCSMIERLYNAALDYVYDTVYLTGSLVGYDLEGLTRESTVIVTGRFVGKSDSIKVAHATAPEWTQIYTDYHFEIENVIKGQPYDQTVSVRLEGGVVGKERMVAECVPKLNFEDEYLLFLYNTGLGGAFETEDDYYSIRGVHQGAFALEEDGACRSVKTKEPFPDEFL